MHSVEDCALCNCSPHGDAFAAPAPISTSRFELMACDQAAPLRSYAGLPAELVRHIFVGAGDDYDPEEPQAVLSVRDPG